MFGVVGLIDGKSRRVQFMGMTHDKYLVPIIQCEKTPLVLMPMNMQPNLSAKFETLIPLNLVIAPLFTPYQNTNQ